MHPEYRARFNADFTDQRYAELVRIANETERWPVDFRISESPIFFTPEFAREIAAAAEEIVAHVRTPEFARTPRRPSRRAWKCRAKRRTRSFSRSTSRFATWTAG